MSSGNRAIQGGDHTALLFRNYLKTRSPVNSIFSSQSPVTTPVITIDGPSGVGKGTLSRLLAHALGWHWLDSGALYRLVALAALKADVALDAVSQLVQLAHTMDVAFHISDTVSTPSIYLNGLDVSIELRSERCSQAASQVATWPMIRDALLHRQRAFRQPPGLIADGRDMGTVVFPDATVKLYLTADPQERARRRYNQLREQGVDANLETLSEAIIERDARDMHRTAAPLKPAHDAYLIDTTNLTIHDVLAQAWAIIARTTP